MEIKYNKTVSSSESALLGLLVEEGKQWFTIEEAYAAFPDKSEGAVRFILKRMLDKGLLIKISRKVYWTSLRGCLTFVRRVPPFGHPRLIGCLLLPGAFRRSLRPSSLSDALASSVCPYSFTP